MIPDGFIHITIVKRDIQSRVDFVFLSRLVVPLCFFCEDEEDEGYEFKARSEIDSFGRSRPLSSSSSRLRSRPTPTGKSPFVRFTSHCDHQKIVQKCAKKRTKR